MTVRRMTQLILFAILVLATAGCAATVPQDEYDQVVADLDDAFAEITTLEADLAEAEADLAEAEAKLTEAEADLTEAEANLTETEAELVEAGTDLAEVQERISKAAVSAEIMEVFLDVGFGSGGDLSEIDAMSVFQDLSVMVEASGDEALQEKFQAVLFSFGGEQETLDLVGYMLGTITALRDQ